MPERKGGNWRFGAMHAALLLCYGMKWMACLGIIIVSVVMIALCSFWAGSLLLVLHFFCMYKYGDMSHVPSLDEY